MLDFLEYIISSEVFNMKLLVLILKYNEGSVMVFKNNL